MTKKTTEKKATKRKTTARRAFKRTPMRSQRGTGKPRKLSPKQALFVSEFLIDRNATQAAVRAGYSKKTARSIGQENLTKPDIAAAIEAGEKAIADRNEISQDRVAQELALLAFSNLQDYMRATSNGDPYVNFNELTREQAAALQEVTIENFSDGRGKDARDVRRIKFKLADKRAALGLVTK